MSIAESVRRRDSKVYPYIIQSGKLSLREISNIINLTKDSIARSINMIFKRNNHPESHFWETEEGKTWLNLLVIAMIYEFGIKGNQGADRMSDFCKRIRIEKHIAVSPSRLRETRREIEKLVVEFQQAQEKVHKGKKRDIIAAGDETWLGDRTLLVLMDLVSGYLVLETEAENRSYATWWEKAESRLKEMGLQVKHFISDRGKSLIKLATSGFRVCAGADIFHAQYDISKWLGRSLHGKISRASKQLREALEKESTLKTAAKIEIQGQKIEQCKKKLNKIDAGKKAYDKAQHAISTALHVFSIRDNTAQNSEQVENQLEDEAIHFEQIAQEQSVPDNKDVVGKFRRQFKDLASVVDAWWVWTTENLSEFKLPDNQRYWLLYVLLPVIYWHHQFQKTKNPEMKNLYKASWHKAQAVYADHPITRTISEADLKHWRSWGEWASNNFHRASSAVEGRNGVLSQCYRNGRGLNNTRLSALTVVHNYDTRRWDGSTPAERLYGEKSPDLFEWLLKKTDALPLPRIRKKWDAPNPLIIQIVAA